MKRTRKPVGKYLPAILTFGDWIVLNLTFFISFIVLDTATIDSRFSFWMIMNAAFLIPSFRLCDVHNRRTIGYDRLMANAFHGTLLTAVIALAVMYVCNVHEPKLSILVFFGVFYLLLSGWSLIARKIVKTARSKGHNCQRSIIIGCGKTARQLIQQLQDDAGYGITVECVFADDADKIEQNIKPEFNGRILHLDDVRDFSINENVNIIYYTMDGNDVPLLVKMMQIAEETGARFIYVPKLPKLMSAQFEARKVGDMHTLAHKFTPLVHTRNRIMKRAFDLAVSVPFAILSPLIFIPIAVGIKISSPGPVFFKQKRTGLFGTEFTCLKFRTMKVNKDSDKIQASKDDPRKTKFGDFLRKTSLDELPQFYNVLWGDMTVVGPRPHMVSQTEIYRQLIDKYMIRHAVKPGITGWAQTNGFRGATNELWQMEKRVEYDVWYITNWNIFLDIKIVVRTFLNQLRGEDNAY